MRSRGALSRACVRGFLERCLYVMTPVCVRMTSLCIVMRPLIRLAWPRARSTYTRDVRVALLRERPAPSSCVARVPGHALRVVRVRRSAHASDGPIREDPPLFVLEARPWTCGRCASSTNYSPNRACISRSNSRMTLHAAGVLGRNPSSAESTTAAMPDVANVTNTADAASQQSQQEPWKLEPIIQGMLAGIKRSLATEQAKKGSNTTLLQELANVFRHRCLIQRFRVLLQLRFAGEDRP